MPLSPLFECSMRRRVCLSAEARLDVNDAATARLRRKGWEEFAQQGCMAACAVPSFDPVHSLGMDGARTTGGKTACQWHCSGTRRVSSSGEWSDPPVTGSTWAASTSRSWEQKAWSRRNTGRAFTLQ